MPTFRIRNWNAHFENNRTRDMKRMSWVPIPVKLAGDGYTEMIEGKDGPAVYGAWIACVLVAASCDPRGTLLRGNGEPHDPQSLSRITRIRTPIIQNMLERAQGVGWIEDIAIPQEGAGIPQESALSGRKESEGRNSNGHPAGADACPMTRGEWNGPGFEMFWAEYPRKVAKQSARKAWAGLHQNGTKEAARERLKAIVGLLRERCDEWDKREPDKIPHPATWLRAEDFTDDP